MFGHVVATRGSAWPIHRSKVIMATVKDYYQMEFVTPSSPEDMGNPEEPSPEDLAAQKAEMAELRAQEDALFYSPPSDNFYPEDEEFREVDPPPSYFKDQELYYVKKDLAKCKEFLEKYLNESRKPSDESNDEFLSRLLEEMDSLHRELCPGEYANGDD